MNTQEAIILMKRLEAAWPNIFARNKEREALYMDQLTPFDYMKASTAINQMITTQKAPPSISDFNQALKPFVEFAPKYVDYGPGRTSHNEPVATYQEAKEAFARGYRKAKPDATDEQINMIFGNMNFGELDQEVF